MRRLLATAVVACAALAVGAGAAGATNECKGFMVCVPIAGPWVVVPAATAAPRPQVEFQLTCPRGYIVGGLDAELTARAIDLQFLGRLGTPVNPGISTARSVVFVGSYVGVGASTQTFRPHAGCIPTSGGGGRRVPTSATRTVPPSEPTVRRVKTLRVPVAGAASAGLGCGANQRLVRASHAVGFYTKTPPSQARLAAVTATSRLRGRKLVATARGGAELAGVRAVVQLGVVCAGGT